MSSYYGASKSLTFEDCQITFPPRSHGVTEDENKRHSSKRLSTGKTMFLTYYAMQSKNENECNLIFERALKEFQTFLQSEKFKHTQSITDLLQLNWKEPQMGCIIEVYVDFIKKLQQLRRHPSPPAPHNVEISSSNLCIKWKEPISTQEKELILAVTLAEKMVEKIPERSEHLTNARVLLEKFRKNRVRNFFQFIITV